MLNKSTFVHTSTPWKSVTVFSFKGFLSGILASPKTLHLTRYSRNKKLITFFLTAMIDLMTSLFLCDAAQILSIDNTNDSML